ncbi:hypothetical protein C8R44DRAFT_977440 [Mycena epipterygia]|nr:hypothetical protein C8R44DRAFT_977440 [Mycena epipterygia]
MFSENPEHSVPSFSFPGSSSDLDSVNAEGFEKHLDRLTSPGTPGLPPHASYRFDIEAFLSKLKGWPAIVIGGHLIIQAVAWTFFSTVQSSKGIALPPSSANWANNNSHAVTLISTAIATALATCSSYLFSLGLRRSLALHLHRDGMSLAAFTASVKISSRSLVLDPRRRRWSATSIILFILTLIQTSGFNTLIRPVGIVIELDTHGTEIDLASSALKQMQDSGELDSCMINSSTLIPFIPGQTESGYAAVKGATFLPASITVMDQTFDPSTAGILSLTRDVTSARAWFGGNTSIPGTLQTIVDPPIGVSQYYVMKQQAFTANVHCEFQDLSDTGVNLQTDTVETWSTGVQSRNVTYTQLTSDCAVGDNPRLNFTYGYTAGTPANASYILMVACESEGNYTLIFQSAGRYNFMKTTVCTVSPKISQVMVNYTDADVFSGTIETETLQPTDAVVDGPASLSAMNTIGNMLFFSQAMDSNIMGDQLNSLLREADLDNYQDADVLSFTAQYITAVIEYSGTVFRACLSATTFPDGLPSNITTEAIGTFYTDTAGWLPASLTTFWVLLPGTLVALTTIFIVLSAVAQHCGEPAMEPFDPFNVVHLLAAAGGLHDVFTGIEEKDIKAVEDVNIVLLSSPGRAPEFIRGTV